LRERTNDQILWTNRQESDQIAETLGHPGCPFLKFGRQFWMACCQRVQLTLSPTLNHYHLSGGRRLK
jgi:hypothetical protein